MKVRTACFKFAFMILLMGCPFALAETITVGPAGEADHQSIQDAIDLAQAGDEVVVYPGIYTIDTSDQRQVVDLMDKDITLRSCEGPEVTIIDGQSVARAIVCKSESMGNPVIDGFTILNGTSVSCDLNDDGQVESWESNGGGALIVYKSSPQVLNCRFIDSFAEENGGAVYARESGVIFDDCIFQGNISESKGGAIYIRSSEVTIVNSQFIMNDADSYGGGICARMGTVELSESIFRSNSARSGSAALHIQNNVMASIAGSIFCENTNGDDETDHIGGSWDDQGGNCFAESCADSDGNGFPDGCDPCSVNPMDSDGDGLCDAIDPCPHYPGACSSILGGGQLIEVAVGESIQNAIQLAQDGDTIQLEPGTYYEAISLLGKSITIRSGQACISEETAVIDATGLLRPVVTCDQNEGPDTRIIGLTLTGGSAPNGGGIYCWFSSPTIEDCLVVGNLAYDDGGGIMLGTGNANIRRCIVRDNMSLEEGGGIFIEYAGATIEDCHFEGNIAYSNGGGVCMAHDGTVSIADCTFASNRSDGAGGGLATINCSATLSGSLFENNLSYYNGGGYYNNGGTGDVSSTRFEANVSIEGAGLGSENGFVNVSMSEFCDNRDPDGILRNIHGDWNDLGMNLFQDSCVEPDCPTDVNNDGVTDVLDLLILLDLYGPCPNGQGCKADIDGNGAVDCMDVLLIIDAWGPCESNE